MSQVTRRGRELAQYLNPYIGTTRQILEVCSLVARHATTHHRLAETECSRELTGMEMAKVEWLEGHIRDLVSLLPRTDDGPIVAMFSGDPRGFTVKLRVPNQPHGGNTWGLGGEFGV